MAQRKTTTTKPAAPRTALRTMRLDDLAPAAYNPRTITDKALAGLQASVRRFGLVQPVIWNERTQRIVGGHQRVKALRAEGATETDVLVVDLPESEEKVLNLTLNSPAISGEFLPHELEQLLKEVEQAEPEAFDDLLLADLEQFAQAQEKEQEGVDEDEGAGDLPEKPAPLQGDLWILGNHLLCGDSTNPDDVARLMDGETAVLLATDPPYLVDYDGSTTPPSITRRPARTKTKAGNDVGNKHWDDYVDPEASVEFFETWLRVALEHCIERVPVYQWHAMWRQALVERAWERNGLFVHQPLIWAKKSGVLTRSHFLWKHEPCFYGWRKGKMPAKNRRPEANQTTVWEIERESEGIHPTQKPLEIFARPIHYHTFQGEVILEPFSGSGSQLIAAEQLNRRCFAMEQSPAFVEAAAMRWERASGKEAILAETGETLAQVRARRAQEAGG